MPAANAVPGSEAIGLCLPDAADRAPALSRALASRLALAPPRQICETRIRGRSRGAEAAGASDCQLHRTGDAQHLGRPQTLSRERSFGAAAATAALEVPVQRQKLCPLVSVCVSPPPRGRARRHLPATR